MGMAADLAIFSQRITLKIISLSPSKHHNLDLMKWLSAPVAAQSGQVAGERVSGRCPDGRSLISMACSSTLLCLAANSAETGYENEVLWGARDTTWAILAPVMGNDRGERNICYLSEPPSVLGTGNLSVRRR